MGPIPSIPYLYNKQKIVNTGPSINQNMATMLYILYDKFVIQKVGKKRF